MKDLIKGAVGVVGLAILLGPGEPAGAVKSTKPSLDTDPKPLNHDPFYHTYAELHAGNNAVPTPTTGDLISWIGPDKKAHFGVVEMPPLPTPNIPTRTAIERIAHTDPLVVNAVDDLGNADVGKNIRTPNEMVASIGQDNLTINELGQLVSQPDFRSGPGGDFRKEDIFYIEALEAKLLATLYHDGMTLDEIKGITANLQMIKDNKDEFRGPVDKKLPRQISVQFSPAVIHEIIHKVLDKGNPDVPPIQSAMSELLPEAMQGFIAGLDSLAAPNSYGTGSCVDRVSRVLTHDDFSAGARQLVEFHQNQLPGIITKLTIKVARAKESVPQEQLEAWVKEDYGQKGLDLFKSKPLLSCHLG